MRTGSVLLIREADLTLVADRKPGRPKKKPDEGETAAPAAKSKKTATATTAKPKKTAAGKGVPAAKKRARKSAAKKAKQA